MQGFTNTYKILIVDDEPEHIHTISQFFLSAQLPYNILIATEGETGLKIVSNETLDLIITDWEMDDMNGIEFIKKCKKRFKSLDIPIIMCTGVMTSSENLETAFKAGAVDYIRKPIDKIELLSRTRSALILSDSRKELLQKNKALVETVATKDKFFSIITHDLRSPFSSILGLTKLLVDDFHTYDIETIEDYIKTIHETTDNTFRLLENLLDWSRVQTGKLKYSPGYFRISEVLEQNISLTKPAAEEKVISVSVLLDEDVVVFADEYMIDTVIRNLLTNAIKFTNRGGNVEIRCYKAGIELKISVSDNGIGIKKDKLEHLFQLDPRYKSKGTENERGTGLGLVLCKDFIDKHNGDLEVQSKPGEGSAFSFSLPIE